MNRIARNCLPTFIRGVNSGGLGLGRSNYLKISRFITFKRFSFKNNNINLD